MVAVVTASLLCSEVEAAVAVSITIVVIVVGVDIIDGMRRRSEVVERGRMVVGRMTRCVVVTFLKGKRMVSTNEARAAMRGDEEVGGA